MAKKKLSGYELFVKEACSRMRREGANPNYVEQLGKLGSEFSNLPDEVKQQYKDRAKNGGGFQSRPSWPPAPPLVRRPSQDVAQNECKNANGATSVPSYFDKPSTSSAYYDRPFSASNNQTWDSNPSVKLNDSPEKRKTEFRTDVDSKPVIKEERGTKRKLDVELYGDGEQHRQESEREVPPEPPKKKGFSIPNWKNIKNSTQPEADRYFDYDMVKKRNCCEEIVNNHIEKLLTFPLYSFSCNVLCKYKENQGDKAKFIPLEIGIAAYTIKDGLVGRPFHALIDSGPVPPNYWGDTSDHMQATHKIMVTKDGKYPPGSRADYRKLYKDMIKYVKEGERTILVADRHDLEQVQGCIEWIYEQFALRDELLPKPSTWTILPLVEFVAAAYNHVYCKMLKYPLPKFTLHYFLKIRLETSLWDYEVTMMCDYHKQDDYQCKWCAKNCAIRAFKAIELTLDEIFKHYKHHEEIELAKPKPNPGSDRPHAPETPKGRPTDTRTASTVSTRSQEPGRVHAQQRQQPLHMPEDSPAPLIEDKARREELRRQELEEARKHFPPAPYFQGYYEIPVSPTRAPMVTDTDSPQPKEIVSGEPTKAVIRPPDEKLKQLDPRLKPSNG